MKLPKDILVNKGIAYIQKYPYGEFNLFCGLGENFILFRTVLPVFRKRYANFVKHFF